VLPLDVIMKLLLASLMAGWLMLWTLILKSLLVKPVNDIGQVEEPFPLLPVDVPALIVPTSVPAFNRTIFTVEPGVPVYLHVTA